MTRSLPRISVAAARAHSPGVASVATASSKSERMRLRGRLGQGLLLLEGLVVGVLGGVALAWSMSHTRFTADGIPMLGLKLTPLHGGLLLGAGAMAVLACLGRR